MRVIAGKARGVKLVVPQGLHTRPTADRVKEALFSIIHSRFELTNTNVLDLCCGTGGLGIEALSRGAAFCCFVENDRNALIALKKNLLTVKFREQAELLEMDVIKALGLIAARGKEYDMIFFDPPYASELYGLVADGISRLTLLKHDGLFIAESSSRNILPEQIGSLVKIDRRVYGDTALELFTPEEK